MEAIGQSFRLGIWAVKPEKRAEFIQAWQTSGEWLAQRLLSERGAILLEDTSDPGRFISLAPLSNPEALNALLAGADFQELWSGVMQLTDDVKPHLMRVVSSVTGKVG